MISHFVNQRQKHFFGGLVYRKRQTKISAWEFLYLFTTQDRPSAVVSMSSPEQYMGETELFTRLVWRPEVCPNRSRMLLITCRSVLPGLREITASSAKKETQCQGCWTASGCIKLSLAAYSTREFRTSITNMKSMGEWISLTKTSIMKNRFP